MNGESLVWDIFPCNIIETVHAPSFGALLSVAVYLGHFFIGLHHYIATLYFVSTHGLPLVFRDIFDVSLPPQHQKSHRLTPPELLAPVLRPLFFPRNIQYPTSRLFTILAHFA